MDSHSTFSASTNTDKPSLESVLFGPDIPIFSEDEDDTIFLDDEHDIINVDFNTFPGEYDDSSVVVDFDCILNEDEAEADFGFETLLPRVEYHTAGNTEQPSLINSDGGIPLSVENIIDSYFSTYPPGQHGDSSVRINTDTIFDEDEEEVDFGFEIINFVEYEEDIFDINDFDVKIRFEPAKKESLDGLGKETTVKAGKCTICLEEVPAGSEVIRLPCSHCYHENCVIPWLERSRFCPLCRFELP